MIMCPSMQMLLYSTVVCAIVSMATASNVVIGVLDGSVTLVCKLPVSETLAWQREDGLIVAVEGHVVLRNSSKYTIDRRESIGESLTIRNLSLHDNTTFSCYDLINPDTKDVTSVSVLVKPFYTKVATPSSDFNEGSRVTLTCESDGGKPLPETRWFRIDNDGSVTEVFGRIVDVLHANGTGRRHHSLTFKVTRDMYRSQFICRVSVSAFYEESLSVDMNVKLLPLSPTITGYSGSYDADTYLALLCTSHGSLPAARLYWMIDGNPVVDFDVVVIPDMNGTYTVTSTFRRMLSRDNNGSVVTCAVKNKVMQELTLEPLMSNITLQVTYAPVVTVSNTSPMVRESSNVTLECRVDAIPAPFPDSLQWLHNGVLADQSNLVFTNNSHSMTIISARREDAGLYSCRVSNKLGTTESLPVRLTVQYRPTCSDNHVTRYAVKIGSSIRLECHMHASPSDVIMAWRYKDKQAVIDRMPASKFAEDKNRVYSAITITISEETHYGTVECSGNNTEGISKRPCLMHIVQPSIPDAPTNCSLVATENGDVVVGVRCREGFDGGSRQTFLLQYLAESKIIKQLSNSIPTFDLEQIYSLTGNVTVRVCAVNKDFPDETSCSPHMTTFVNSSVPSGQSLGSVFQHPNHTGIIIGVTAAVLFFIITFSLVLYFVWKKKKNKKPELVTNLPSDVRGKRQKVFLAGRRDTMMNNINQQTTSAELGLDVTSFHSVETVDLDPDNSTILASTPYLPARGKINREIVSPGFIEKHFQSNLNPALAHIKSKLNGAPGMGQFGLSPIKKVPMQLGTVRRCRNEEPKRCLDSLATVDMTTVCTVCYSEADIAAVLDGTTKTAGKAYSNVTYDCEKCNKVLEKQVINKTGETREKTVAQVSNDEQNTAEELPFNDPRKFPGSRSKSLPYRLKKNKNRESLATRKLARGQSLSFRERSSGRQSPIDNAGLEDHPSNANYMTVTDSVALSSVTTMWVTCVSSDGTGNAVWDDNSTVLLGGQTEGSTISPELIECDTTLTIEDSSICAQDSLMKNAPLQLADQTVEIANVKDDTNGNHRNYSYLQALDRVNYVVEPEETVEPSEQCMNSQKISDSLESRMSRGNTACSCDVRLILNSKHLPEGGVCNMGYDENVDTDIPMYINFEDDTEQQTTCITDPERIHVDVVAFF